MNNIDLYENQIIDYYKNEKMSMLKISKIFNVDSSVIKRILQESNVYIRHNDFNSRVYSLNEQYFDILTPESAYWLGFIYADGYITTHNVIGLKLSITDENHLNAFRKAISSNKPIYKKIEKCPFNNTLVEWCSLTVNSKHMYNKLTELGVYCKKSLILKFPDNNVITNENCNHFIRGYFDGDGSVYNPAQKRFSHVSFCGTFEFLSVMKDKLNGIGKIYKDKRTNKNTFVYVISKYEDVKYFYEFIYENATIFLNRKQEKFKKCWEDDSFKFQNKHIWTNEDDEMLRNHSITYFLLKHKNMTKSQVYNHIRKLNIDNKKYNIVTISDGIHVLRLDERDEIPDGWHKCGSKKD